jgi:hypothetical protein
MKIHDVFHQLAVRREDHCVDHLTVKDLVVGGGDYRHFLGLFGED